MCFIVSIGTFLDSKIISYYRGIPNIQLKCKGVQIYDQHFLHMELLSTQYTYADGRLE